MERNGFVKSHALGNDYIIVDPQTLSFPLTERAIRLICDRHFGVGSDGILTPAPSVTADSMGNPHCVVFVPDLRRVDLHHLGPRLERHPLFPKRTNVQFAQVQAHDRVAALIWERGAGETLASGSSACAVAAAAVRKALVDRTLTIAMQGGDLQISVSPDWSIEMTGPAAEICTGSLSEPFLSALEAGE